MLYQYYNSIIFWCIFIHFGNVLIKADPYGNNDNKSTHITINNVTQKVQMNVETEGGTIILPDKDHIRQESTLARPSINNNVSTEATSVTKPLNSSALASNHLSPSPSIVHHGRERIITQSTDKPSTVLLHSVINTTVIGNTSVHLNNTVSKIIPVNEISVSSNVSKIAVKEDIPVLKPKPLPAVESSTVDFSGDSKIKARKGVMLSETTKSTTLKPTTKKPKKMKPTVTIGSDDEPYPPSNFVPPKISSSKEHIANSSNSKLHASEDVVGIRHFKKGPDYVLPIVMTILAVPLFAIIIAVLYKRGAEWWHHRHYRRMDFLIDGMYNN